MGATARRPTDGAFSGKTHVRQFSQPQRAPLCMNFGLKRLQKSEQKFAIKVLTIKRRVVAGKPRAKPCKFRYVKAVGNFIRN